MIDLRMSLKVWSAEPGTEGEGGLDILDKRQCLDVQRQLIDIVEENYYFSTLDSLDSGVGDATHQAVMGGEAAVRSEKNPAYPIFDVQSGKSVQTASLDNQINHLGLDKRPVPVVQRFQNLAKPQEAFAPLAARLAAMQTAGDPCPGFRLLQHITGPASEWPDVWYHALQALHEFETQATAMGWRSTDLLGVHPVVGMNRLDYAGAFLLGHSPVKRLTEDTVTYANGLKFYRGTTPADAVPIWAFGRVGECGRA